LKVKPKFVESAKSSSEFDRLLSRHNTASTEKCQDSPNKNSFDFSFAMPPPPVPSRIGTNSKRRVRKIKLNQVAFKKQILNCLINKNKVRKTLIPPLNSSSKPSFVNSKQARRIMKMRKKKVLRLKKSTNT